jgi:terminase small subunit-like protein
VPALKNYRHEVFAQHFVKTNNASESYRVAGYNGRNYDVQAHKLVVNGSIVSRIAEIRRELQAKSPKDKGFAIDELWRVAMGAEREGDRISAIAQISRMLGWDQPTRVMVSADPLMTYMQELRSMPIERGALELKTNNGPNNGMKQRMITDAESASVERQ